VTGHEEGRVGWVDGAKGICIILVVMMHSSLGVSIAMGEPGPLNLLADYARPFRIPDFFLIGGLFASRVIRGDWRMLIDRKVVYFAYFYILWFAIQSGYRLPVALWQGDHGTVSAIALGLVEPLGTLWFIYLLPIFFVVTKATRGLPAWAVFVAAALLESLRIHSGWSVVDEFAARYVYFFAGYWLADTIFAFAERIRTAPAFLACLALAAWALINGVLALGPAPAAQLPGLSLVLGFAGALAIVATSVLLGRAGLAGWLRFCGSNSIVIYLAFPIPMAAARLALVKSGIINDVGVVQILVTICAVAVPLASAALVRGTVLDALFRRPAWAHLPKPAAEDQRPGRPAHAAS
jgi:uncharacterized membrane protein YcfT